MLSGCGTTPAGSASTSPTSPAAIKATGRVMGGQQPITGGLIQLYAVGTTADGSAATPLLTATVTTSDGTGQANSNANAGNANNTLTAGSFVITGDYNCPSASTLVYMTASGGNPGLSGANTDIQQMIAIGACGSLTSSTNLELNEITTVAAIAALHSYMSAYNAVGSSSSDASALSSAFNTASEYANPSTGSAPGPNLPSGDSASTSDLIALANVVAACVNSAGGTYNDSSSCGNLFYYAKPPSGAAPADTAAALMDIANNPSNNVTQIFNLQPAQAAFGGASTTAPANWSLPITNNSVTTTVAISANPNSIPLGNSSVLTITVANANSVIVTGTDGSSNPVSAAGGQLTVTPTATTTYTATATGADNTATATAQVTVTSAPTVTLSASPVSIVTGGSSTLTVTATNATSVMITGSDNSSYALSATGGTQSVSPASTTTYTATASNSGGSANQTAQVTVNPATGSQAVQHVIFMLQENHSFDNYFGMLNPYRTANGMSVGADGNTYLVDGIDDKYQNISNTDDEGTSIPLFKLTSSCVQDLTSSWLESYGDESEYNFGLSRATSTQPMPVNGFVHTAENYAKNCQQYGGESCAGNFYDLTGKPAMGYYDQTFLNYYYYMASQFALSDRWFSPISSKSIPNRIATFTGGTTQGLAFDPGGDDHLGQLDIPTIFAELSTNNVSWKIYYTVTQGGCTDTDGDCASKGASAVYPATDFSYLQDSYKYLYENTSQAACVPPTVQSSQVGDTTNTYCVDPTHIAPLSQYYTDVQNNTLPAFAFIEAGYGVNDEHPGSGQSILSGQAEVAQIVNALMGTPSSPSPSWSTSVFFMAYDEGGGPYDHVPPVQGHTNDHTTASVVGNYPTDISSISINPDSFNPCVPAGGFGSPATYSNTTGGCDLVSSGDPGATNTDAAAIQGFAAQLGFRLPNMVISPFSRAHYVSHVPMDHTAILKFVESRFISPNTHLTSRDAAQPDLLDFFDFTGVPWATPPTPPTPVSPTSLGYDPCTPTNLGP